MAVAAMRRFELLGHINTKAEILRVIQELGIAHVDDARALVDTQPEGTAGHSEPQSTAESTYQTVQQCLRFVDTYAELPGLLEKLKQPRLPVTAQQFEDIGKNFALDLFADRVRDIESKLTAARARIAKAEVLSEDLNMWLALGMPLEDVRPTAQVEIHLAAVDTIALSGLRTELSGVSERTHLSVLHEGHPTSSLVLFYLSELSEQVGPILKKYGCRIIDFSGVTGTPKEAQVQLREDIAALRTDIEKLEAEARVLAKDRPQLLMLSDYYADQVEAAGVESQMLHTQTAYLLSGWVPEEQADRFSEQVKRVSPAIALTMTAPADGDTPPVLLDNAASEPFEMITDMYGTPKYHAVDPTPRFAPWFAFFFGLCLTDAGYGIVLAIVLGWALKTLPLEGGVRQLARVLLFGSIFTVFGGAVTGGWFGMEIDSLPNVLQKLVWIQPMLEAERALFTALGIGVIHLLLGVSIKMFHNVKQGRAVEAILDQGVWLVFIVAVTPLVYTGIFNQTIQNGALLRGAAVVSLACTLIVILTGAREGSLLARPLMGLLKLYDLVGYFGDALSYSRLLALGLATGAIGSAINLIAGQIVEASPPGIGYAIAIPLLVFGHGFNIIINVLGAFIHSMRLQFIEFFGKFFEDGGQPFRPFTHIRNHVHVTPQ